jgi:hypothetical protein
MNAFLPLHAKLLYLVHLFVLLFIVKKLQVPSLFSYPTEKKSEIVLQVNPKKTNERIKLPGTLGVFTISRSSQFQTLERTEIVPLAASLRF